ncbi:metallo-beta lactamase [Sulfuricaulis limicola]|uniref:Metallo-beta lactamase n=1 Tax=Sulfuricaulis limicola TaxID=1620215 RepID=A0A1B4XES6_9GAMM|nr:hypothetical protein [Sulfuricaulis limicola]BAV33300.1 metallo-beta lactamase [Sulfuricaulis limicola]
MLDEFIHEPRTAYFSMEIALSLAILTGFWKTLSYGLRLTLHAVSTLVTYRELLSPFGKNHMYLHDSTDPQQRLAEIINRTVKRGGAVIVPAFAVGRAQALMYLIHLLKESNAIPDIPVLLNSPMAVNATRARRPC